MVYQDNTVATLQHCWEQSCLLFKLCNTNLFRLWCTVSKPSSFHRCKECTESQARASAATHAKLQLAWQLASSRTAIAAVSGQGRMCMNHRHHMQCSFGFCSPFRSARMRSLSNSCLTGISVNLRPAEGPQSRCSMSTVYGKPHRQLHEYSCCPWRPSRQQMRSAHLTSCSSLTPDSPLRLLDYCKLSFICSCSGSYERRALRE